MAEQQTTRKILDIQVRYDAALEAITRYRDVIDNAKEEQKRLKQELEKGNLTQRQAAKEMEVINQAVLRSKERIRQLSKEVQNNVRIEKEKEGSLKALRAELSNATAAYDAMSRAERNTAKGKELQNHINEITKELKGVEYETQRFYRNVGNYQSAFSGLFGAIPGLSGLGGIAGNMGSSMASAASAGGILSATMAGVGVAITAASAAFADGAKTAMDYNQAVSALAAVQGKTAEQMKYLTDQARELGATTRYTAMEVVQLQTELAKLGYGQEQIHNMTTGVLSFAQATGASLADAASLAGASLRMFGATSEQTGEYVDAMAMACTSSALDFSYLQTAMSTVGPVANAFGFSIKDTLSLLGQLANAGFDASSAATATRNILLNLANEGGKLAQALGRPIKTISDLTAGLQKLKLEETDLQEALQMTDKRSVAQFSVFLNNAKAIDELSGKLAKADGAAQQMAKTMGENLAGKIAGLGSAWDDLMLTIQGAQEWQIAVVEWLTTVIRKTGEVYGKIKFELQDLYNESMLFRSVIVGIGNVINVLVDVVKGACHIMADEFVGVGKIVKGIFTLDWDTFAEGMERATKGIKESFKNMAQEIWDDTKKTYSEVINGKVVITQTTTTEGEGGEETGSSPTTSGSGKVYKSEKELQKEAKERERIYQQEIQAVRKAEDEMLKLVNDSADKQRQVTAQKYDRQIADLKHKLETDKTLTETSQQAINKTIEALEQQKVKALADIDKKISENAIKQRQEEIKALLDTVKEGTDAEFTLRMEQLENQKQLELAALADKENAESLRLAIIQKYRQKEIDLDKEQDQVQRERELEAMQQRFDMQNLLLDEQHAQRLMKLEEEGAADTQLEWQKMYDDWETKKQILAEQEQELQDMKVTDYATREEYEKAHQEKMNQIDKSRLQVMEAQNKQQLAGYNAIKSGIEAMGEVNAGFAKAAKIIALGEIAVNTGKALAAGIAQAQSVPYPANLAAIATTVGTILANVASAISTVKSAKFAKGGVNIQGAGTGTSDSISAKLSQGESVMTAKATQMYGGLLLIMNKMANNPSYTLPTSYPTYQFGAQTTDENEAQNESMEAIIGNIRPVVSVEEIREVTQRVEAIETLNSF